MYFERGDGGGCVIHLFNLVIIRTENSSWSGVMSIPSMGSHYRASAARCLKPARCRTSKSNSDRQSSHVASLPVAFAEFKNH